MAKKTIRSGKKVRPAKNAGKAASEKKSIKKTAIASVGKKTVRSPKVVKKVVKTAKSPTKTKAIKTAKKVQPLKSRKTVKPVKAVKPVKTLRPAKLSSKTAGNKKKYKISPREKMIREIRKKLLQQKNALLSEAEEALNALPGQGQTVFPDLGDQASAEIDRSFMLRLRGREQRLLKKIEEAIEKIETGSFGICEVCGQKIDSKRLIARPVTTMCILCKTEQEEEEKVRGV